MRYLLPILLIMLAGCSPTAEGSGAQLSEVAPKMPARAASVARPLYESSDAAEPEMIEFDIRKRDLGRDHVGCHWTVKCLRELGCDDWLVVFSRDGVECSQMNIGRLKCGHHPEVRMEVCSYRESFMVVTQNGCWGTGVWSTCERWYTLDRLDDHSANVLDLDVSGHQYGWGLAFNRDFVATSELNPHSAIEVQVTGTLDVMRDEIFVFQSVRKASYCWNLEYRRFFPTNHLEDEALRGMWNDAEDGLVAHSHADLRAWFQSPSGDPAFIHGLLAEAEMDSTRQFLRQLLALHG